MVAKGIDEATARKYLDQVRNLTPNETIKIIFDYLDKSGFDSTWYKLNPPWPVLSPTQPDLSGKSRSPALRVVQSWVANALIN